MPFPSGTIYYIPITVNKAKVDSVFSYFAYSIDLSSKLAGDATFKSYISSGANIAIYDPVADSIRPRQIFLDLTNNRLLIYFDSSTSTSIDKVYYVCVGTGVSQVSSISALSNSGFIHYWGFNNFEASPTGCADYVGSVGLSIVSQATIAEGKFGPSSVGLGTNGYLRGTYQVPAATPLMFEFLLNMDPLTSDFGVIFQNHPIGCYGWSNAGNTYLILTYDGGSNQIFKIGITPNVWHHVTVIKSGDQWADIYVDGVLFTYGYPGTYSPSSTNFNFLNNDLNVMPLKGFVDDFGIRSYDASYASWIITRYNMFISPATFWTIGSGTYYYHVNADFSAASLSVNVGDNVNFTNLSEGYPAISGYDWDLDDGFSSSDTNPVQSWTIVGPKTISLTATNDYGSDTETKTDYINVWLLAANFTADTATPFQNQDIQFTDLTEHSGTLLTWDWDFGDGTPHSSEQNPIHSYSAIGYKTVTLIVTSTDGTDSITKTNCINVIEFVSGFSKITLISSTKNISIDPPIFGYTTKIRFPFEYVPIECGTFALYDMGVGAASFNMYDKRECICDFELTNQESASLNDFIQSARNETISLVVPPNSGFYPMGPDKGNCGTFSAVIERVKHKGMLNEPFRYFGDQLRFQFTACCSSSLPTQIPDGTFQIGSITDLRFPEDMFDPDYTFAYYPQLTEGSTAKFVDRGSLSDIRLTQFTLRSNTSKAAALVNHIVTTIRTNQTSIVAQPEHYPFGINDGDNQTFDAFMIQDTLSIRHNRFNEFEMQLRFLLEKHIAPSSQWFYTTPSEFLSHNNDGIQIWQ